MPDYQHPTFSPRSSPHRWWLGTLAGIATGLLLSALLSYAALLPFYLGLFFFLLFGLMIGAAVYRVAHVARPLPVGPLIIGTTAVALITFIAALQFEWMQLGRHCGNWTIKQVRQLPPDRTADDIKHHASHAMTTHLAEQYPPGRLLGYVRWAATNGSFRFDAPPGTHPAKLSYRLSQSSPGWIFRVTFCLSLLLAGVFSQTWPLRHPESPAAEDDPDPAQHP